MADVGSVDPKAPAPPRTDAAAGPPKEESMSKAAQKVLDEPWSARWCAPSPRPEDRFLLSAPPVATPPSTSRLQLRGITPDGADAVTEALRDFASRGPVHAAAVDVVRTGQVAFDLSRTHVMLSPKEAEATFKLGAAQVSVGGRTGRNEHEQFYLHLSLPSP